MFGSQGTIQKVWDQELGKPVAVKVLDVSQSTSFRRRKAAFNEAIIMSNFDHENIMALREILQSDDHIHLVMDLMVDDLRNIFE